MRLEGKRAIVTGGGSGFGAGICRKFATEGAKVALVDIERGKAEAIAAEIGGKPIIADVSDGTSVARMVEAAEDALGGIDILVNNAGITHLPSPLEEVSEADFDRVLAVNCKSVYFTARHVVPLMKAAGGGAIVNMASTAGISPRPRLNWYNASKGWMIAATKAMAIELAPEGIRVNALCPVAGDTPLLPSFMGEDTPETRARFLATIPMGRFSTAEDLANAAAFLASDEAALITGVALEVDGGRCI